MQIGFVNFSQEELARKNKVLQMVRDQTAIDELDNLIIAREKAVKPGRNKLRNPKYKGEERKWPSMLSFRWNQIVYQVITEIREAK